MTQEEELLFKDLCMRLPYGVVVETQLVNAPRAKYPVTKLLKSYMLCDFMQTIENVIHKPYLRPMSSMTEEERKEWSEITNMMGGFMDVDDIEVGIDWLNKHHFDYRGLIDKGLAIKVTKDNNPYK